MLRFDHNELPYNAPYNRYPSADLERLGEVWGKIEHIPPQCIYWCGSGSEQAVDWCLRLFCRGKGQAAAFTPSRSLYRRRAQANFVDFQEFPLHPEDGFRLNADSFLRKVSPAVRLLFVCSPNNPTGTLADTAEVERILSVFSGMVVVDESYMNRTQMQTLLPLMNKYSNLVILRSFSHTWNAAALRMAALIAHPDVIERIKRMGYAHPLSLPQIEAATHLVRNIGEVYRWNRRLVEERERMAAALRELPSGITVFPSAANFLFVEFQNSSAVCQYLRKQDITVKPYGRFLRIGILLPATNAALLAALRKGNL